MINFSIALSSEVEIQIVSEKSYGLNYIDQNDSILKGYTADLIKAVMNDTGLKYNISVKPWARAYHNALNDKGTFIYSIGRTPERENKFIWLGSIITIKNYIYSFNDNTNISLDELKLSRIAATKDTMNYNYLKKHNFKHLVTVYDYKEVFKLLKRGRLKYFTSSVMGVFRFIEENNIDVEKVRAILPILDFNPTLYFAANIDTDKDIVNKVKSSFQNIIDNGTYHKIMQPLLDKQKSIKDSGVN